jgi:hypothetical protein
VSYLSERKTAPPCCEQILRLLTLVNNLLSTLSLAKVTILSDMIIKGSKMTFWRLKLRLNSPDGVTRQEAIHQPGALLEHRREGHQQRAAALLAKIGHPLAVRWALQCVTNRDSAELSAGLLEQIITDFPNAVEPDCLERLAMFDDPLQRIATPPVSMGGRQHPANWENYRAVNCSALREKARAELQRRAEAEAQWRAVDEDEKQKRQAAIPASVERRTA